MKEVNDFVDVTLACEDGHQVDAHKVILAGQVLFSYFHFFMNIIIIQMNIVFEQLPNFPFLKCVSIKIRIGVDDLVNIGLNKFFAHQVSFGS